MPDTNETDLIAEIKERFKIASTATEALYETMVEDLKFLNGDQWPLDLKQQREADGRPCLRINKLPAFHDRIVGDQRRNRPSIKVHPVDDKSDPDTAKVLTGLIRNIEVQSNADVAYDTAYDGASSCGLGAFRITTEYADDDVFDQDIKIKRIKNQFTVYVDPACQEADFSDARYMFVTEKMDREEYDHQYPKASTMEFQAHRDEQGSWVWEKQVRVAEYFWKETKKKKLFLIQMVDEAEPKAVFEDELPTEENYTVLKERNVETDVIKWVRVNAHEVLEGPQEWPGRYIPVILVTGKETNIENETVFRGIVRHSKDSQRLYNYNRSQQAEINALAPRAPFIATAKQIKKYKHMWDNQHKRSYPYLLFEPDTKNPGPPERQWPQPPSTGIQNEILIADQELHDTTGLPLASMGEKSNEKSGKAIAERRLQGDIGQIVYADNLGRAMRFAGKVLIDLIPKIYDVPRIVRILNEDETEEHVQLNAPFQDKETGKERIYDVTTGKYDVTVSVGPSYQTQRQEAADSMSAFIQAFPESAPIVSDLMVKNMDWPGAEEISQRLKRLVPPQVLGPEPEDGEPPPPPDPAEVEQQAQQAAMAESEVKIKMMEAEKAALEVEKEREEVRKTKAEADQAEIEARIGAELG
jgi:hypothetical protein